LLSLDYTFFGVSTEENATYAVLCFSGLFVAMQRAKEWKETNNASGACKQRMEKMQGRIESQVRLDEAGIMVS
jgi:hypothetical protein